MDGTLSHERACKPAQRNVALAAELFMVMTTVQRSSEINERSQEKFRDK